MQCRHFMRRPASLVHFEVAASRIVLPDTSVELACVDGHIDVIGPMTVARSSRYAIGSRVQLLSLDAITASTWLGVPLALLTDRIVSLRDISSTIADRLTDSFTNELISDRLMMREFAVLKLDPRAHRAVALLTRGDTVSRTADAVHLGNRQFTRWFHQQTGLHPKRYQRIERLRSALLMAKDGQPLAAVAADVGYSDQAHFTRDARSLTGAAPRAILPNVGNVQDLTAQLGEQRSWAMPPTPMDLR